MNNDLEQFSEERLINMERALSIGSLDDRPTMDEMLKITRIALVAKQAKPTFEEWMSNQSENIEVDCGCVTTEAFYHWLKVAYESTPHPVFIPEEKPHTDGLLADGWNSCRAQMLYRTPQPAHTEKDGWKLVPEEATIAMLTLLGMTGSFEFMQQKYKNMIAAAPKPESE